MPRRLTPAALALACATLLAACNPASLGSAALPSTPTLQPGALSQPTLAEAKARSTVQGLANVACKAVANTGAYASLVGEPKPVFAVMINNGHAVRVLGTRRA